ncbi:organic cation transporter protein-like [Ruditapes philippinarum]|uniref:organic cation transporter protein-like n=1 Tax=Ruditapes philippinarum TaxID=129788 RepID=UPI00295AA5B3|nr:organic cation transporter protein-like [Ruditapes philippinarum]
MKFDDVLKKIGEFGTYQKVLYVVVCLPAINCGILMLISVFALGVPKHRCAIPGYDNDTYDACSILVNETIPLSNDPDLKYNACYIFPMNVSNYDNYSYPINATSHKCDKWVYDKSEFEETLTTEFNLVCEDAKVTKQTVIKTLFFAGFLVGSIGFGFLSDRFGRKNTLHSSFMLVVMSGITIYWVKSVTLYIILRFLVGAACAGIFLTSYVIGMEMVGPSKRLWAGTLIHTFFAIGHVTLAGMAYFVRDWRNLELYAAIPNIVYLAYYWLIPESPRWLLANGRREEAECVLRKAAKINGVRLQNGRFLDRYNENEDSGKVWHLFRSRVMTIRTLVIFFNWLVVALVYYGLSLSANKLGINVYLDFLLLSLCEFPACALCILLFNRIGRKKLHMMFMGVGGLACIGTVISKEYGDNNAAIALSLIGKTGAAGAFASIYVYSAELFPTTVRNSGIGASSCAARLGAMAAPIIADINGLLNTEREDWTMVIFGSASLAAGILTLLLPETVNRALPETIEDAERFTMMYVHEEQMRLLER